LPFFLKSKRWTRLTLSRLGMQTQYGGEEAMGIQGWEALGPWLFFMNLPHEMIVYLQ
jgi:hypothetical protein